MNREVVRRIGIAEVEERVGRDRTTIRRWLKAGTFPAPDWISGRRCWTEETVEAWVAAQQRPKAFNLPSLQREEAP